MADKNYSENKRIKLISGKSFARIMVTLILLATATTKACTKGSIENQVRLALGLILFVDRVYFFAQSLFNTHAHTRT